jgi:hypothetical protein
MNYFQKKLNKNLRNFIKDEIVDTYIIPNKRNKFYKRKDGRIISHRVVVKFIRKIMKKKSLQNEDFKRL